MFCSVGYVDCCSQNKSIEKFTVIGVLKIEPFQFNIFNRGAGGYL